MKKRIGVIELEISDSPDGEWVTVYRHCNEDVKEAIHLPSNEAIRDLIYGLQQIIRVRSGG